MKPALLVIDMQRAYCEGSSKDSMENAKPYINGALKAFRDAKLPVAWIYHTGSAVKQGDPDFEMIEGLVPAEGERRFVKEYGNAFNKTELGPYLRSLGVDTLVVTGYCAEYCVLSTIRGAEDQDFAPIVLSGALASGDKDNIRFVERIGDYMSYGAMAKLLAACKA